MACEHHRLGDVGAAESAYRATIELRPDHALALLNLGLILRDSGRLELAVDVLGRAAEHASGDADILGAYGSALAESERWPEANDWLDKAHALAPGDPVVRFNLAQASQRLQRSDRAVALLQALVEEIPGDPEIWTVLGTALNDTGHFDEAVAALRHALALEPKAADAHNELGSLYLESGQFEEAATAFRRAIALKPTLTGAIWNLSRTRKYTREDRGEIEAFERTLRRADITDTKRAEVHFTLGKVYEDCEDFAQAVPHYEQANRLRAKRSGYDAARRLAEVERIVGICSYETLRSLGDFGPSSQQPIFIVGMPRSGTSLVEQVIAAHSQASGAGELNAIPRLVKELAVPTEATYPAYLPALTHCLVTEARAAYLEALHVHGEPAAARITDKLPGNFNFLGLISVLFPHARVVHCRRDPMDVGMSLFTRPFTDGHEYSYRLADIAVEFHAYRRLMEHWVGVCPLEIFEVDYEAIIDQPEPELRGLIDFCGLAWEPQCLEFHHAQRRVRTASQWQVRQPIYATSVERWRRFGPLGAALEQQLTGISS